jgi:small subunit ribosomal protein S4
MGDPKKKHKSYSTPKRPYETTALMDDLRLIGAYGLRNKRELWKAHSELSKIRGRARDLLSLETEERGDKERQIIRKLAQRGMVMETSRIEDVLTLTVEDMLERRLQTYVYRRGMANSLYQARQLITHGHIAVGDRKVTSPSYNVKVEDEETLDFAQSSPFSNPDHPFRHELEVVEAIEEEM